MVTEAPKGSLSLVGHQSVECKCTRELDCETGVEQERIGTSDPATRCGAVVAQRIKVLGDNRLILPKSSYRRHGLAPSMSARRILGLGRSQGLGCSPIKAVRELGSERRETVRSLSSARVGELRRAVLSTRGPGRTNRWYVSCTARCMADWLRSGWITAESI